MNRVILFACIALVFSYTVDGRSSKGSSDCSLETNPDCCPCFPDEKVQESFDQLYFQYTVPPISLKQLCKNAMNYLKTLKNYTKNCCDEKIGKLFTISYNGFEKSWNDWCAPHAPRLPKCDREVDAFKGIQACIDRSLNAGYYIIKNLPQKDEIRLYCYTLPLRKECMYNAAKKYCGKKYADMLTEKITGQRQEYIDTYCSDSGDSCDDYEDAKKEIEDIMKNSKTTGRSMAYVVYKTHLDTFQSECVTYD